MFSLAGFAAAVGVVLISVITGDEAAIARAIGPAVVGIVGAAGLRGRVTLGSILTLSLVVLAAQPLVNPTSAVMTNTNYAVIGVSLASMLVMNRRLLILAIAGAAFAATGYVRVTALGEPASEASISGLLALVVTAFGVQLMQWAKQEVGHTEARYRNLFDNSPIATFEEDFTRLAAWLEDLRAAGVTDVRTHLNENPELIRRAAALIEVTDANDAALRFVEAATREDVLGPLNVDSIVEDTSDVLVSEVEALWNGVSRLRVDLKGRTARKNVIDGYLLFAAPASEGRIDWSRVVVAMVDVSDLRDAQRRLEDLLESKDRFVASVSHELRTPLTAVIGLAQELRRAGNGHIGQEERDQLVSVIADQANDVGYIIEDLLVAARADSGQISIRLEAVDVRAALNQVIDGLQVPPGRDLTVCGDAVVMADPHRLRQMLRNLLSNAFRYGGSQIDVRFQAGDSQAVVDVRDDGDGIPRDLSSAVFEAYETGVSRSGVTNSVGLGLTVSRQLARLMGGDITYSREGGWTVFRLILPTPSGRAAA
jgi:signal transduction histidine kinase